MLCGPYWVGWMYGLSGSVCQEGGRVVWGEGLGAEGDEAGVVGGGEGVDGFGGGEGLLAEGCGFAARCGVEYGDAVGKGGGAGVTAGGGGAADAVGEGGEEQEAAGGEGVAPGVGDGHGGGVLGAAGGPDSYRVICKEKILSYGGTIVRLRIPGWRDSDCRCRFDSWNISMLATCFKRPWV